MDQVTLEIAAVDPDQGAVTHPLPGGILVDRTVRVRMRDGVTLGATVYRPEAEGRYPVVVCVTAYGKDFGPSEYSTLPKIKAAGMAVGTMHISEVTTWEGPDPGFWVPAGYVVVVADARGFFGSEGDAGIYAMQDAEDYEDLIEWAGVQPWSSGAVGLNGVSYLAITQWMVASQTKPSHLKAIIPWEGVTDLLRDSFHHGGIPETRFRQAWLAGSLARGAGPGIVEKGPAMLEAALERPFPIEAIDVPALVCASWSDHGLHSRGSLEGFERISSSRKWLYTHGGNKWDVYYSDDALQWQKAFFDHFLKGEQNGFDTRPAVRLEVRRTKEDVEVRSEAAWPVSGVDFQPLYLDLNQGRLLKEAPAGAQSRSYDATEKNCLKLEVTFDRRTELTGPAALRLWVSALDTDDLDLFVALHKIDRNGDEVHFCGKDGFRQGVLSVGWLRVSKRHLDSVRSRPWRPFLSLDRTEKVRPGEIVPVDIEILAASTVFEAGETLRLAVSGRDIMEHARFGHDDTVNTGRHAVHAGGQTPSRLLLPFVYRA